MVIIFNDSLVSQNQTITLTRDLTNQTYKIICSAVNTKPDVSLSLYDTYSSLPLSNSLNSIKQSSCNSNNLCSGILQVNFQFPDSRFDSMSSLSCTATSIDPNIQLIQSISRNTTVYVNLPTTSTKTYTILKDKQG